MDILQSDGAGARLEWNGRGRWWGRRRGVGGHCEKRVQRDRHSRGVCVWTVLEIVAVSEMFVRVQRECLGGRDLASAQRETRWFVQGLAWPETPAWNFTTTTALLLVTSRITTSQERRPWAK